MVEVGAKALLYTNAMSKGSGGGNTGQVARACTVSAFRQALRMPDKSAGRLLQLPAARTQRRLRAVDPARDVPPKHLRASDEVSR